LTWPLRLLRRTLPSAMVVVLLAGVGAGWTLVLQLEHPFPGLALTWRKELKLYAVSLSTPPEWPGLAAGMTINDRILCIDGYRPTPNAGDVYGLDPRYADVPCPRGEKTLAEAFRQRFDAGNPTVEIVVDREGQIITAPNVPLIRFTPVMLAETFLPSFLLGLGLLAVGAVVYRANPSAEVNLVFALLVVILAGLMMSQGYEGVLPDQINGVPILLILVAPWMPLIGAVSFHLVSLLTDQAPLLTLARWLRRPYYVCSALFSLLGVLVYVLDVHPVSFLLSPPYFLFAGISSAAAAAWGLLGLGWTWQRTTSRRVRRQTGLICLGAGAMVGYMAPQLAYFLTNAPAPRYSYNAPYMGLVFVAVLAYAILRYQLFASKARILTALLVTIWCVLAANLIYLALESLPGFLPILIVALVTGLGLAARRGPTAFFTRLLRRETLDYQAVARFSRRVGELQSTESLLAAAQQSLQEDLDVEHVDVWLLPLGEERPALSWFHDGRPAGSQPIPAAFVGHLQAQSAPSHATAPAAAAYHALWADRGTDPIAVWAPLVERGQAVGLLGLGPRWTGEVYDDQDLQLIGILARQLALSVLNTRQLERLQDMARLIVQAEENERLKIARELHDTILQFLLLLTYGLDDLKEQQRDLTVEVEQWQDRISAESSRLRDLLSYLRAPEVLVQQGLVSSLQAWIAQMSRRADVSIQAELSPAAEVALTVGAQVAIYRVFREAIHNALKHAGGDCIVVRLWREGEWVRFSIKDNGRGFDVAQAGRGGGKGYSSLQDMRTHVENVGGRLSIQSAPGEGTCVEGQVPVGDRRG